MTQDRHAPFAEPGLDVPTMAARPFHQSAVARAVSVCIGLILVGAAVIMAWRAGDQSTGVVDRLQAVPIPPLMMYGSVLVATVLANIALTGVMFSILLSPDSRTATSNAGRVGWMEMQALIAASTLLNYIPLRPGLLGRVAYHRTYHNIPVAHSIRAIVQAVALSAVNAGLVIIVMLGSWALGAPGWLAAVVPIPAWCALLLTRHRAIGLAGLVRYSDLLMTALRYFASFSLLGLTIDSRGCLGFACISAISTMIPLFGSGLGLREWAVGLCSPILTPHQISLGLTADLLNRAAEICVVVPTGLIALAILARRRTRHG